jgi:membrane-associated phospholipid phosphatase
MRCPSIQFISLQYKFVVALLLLIAPHSFTFAQDKKPDVASPETPKEKKLEKKLSRKMYSLPQFFHESTLFVKQPTKWKGKDWIKLGTVVATTFAVMPLDERITNSTQGQQRYFHSFSVEGGRIYGEWYSIGSVAGIFGIYGAIAKDTTAKKISIELFQAGVYSELIAVVLKVLIGRERPISTEDPFHYRPFNLKYDFQSMPSGHTTSAFALSTVMSRQANSTGLKILAYVPAGFTMFSRIYQHQHWLSDEIIGAALGYFVGRWVVDLHQGKKHRINVTSAIPIGISYTFNSKKIH